MIARTSITLRPPLRKAHLLLAAMNLRMYSNVNQAIHTPSTRASASLSFPVFSPSSSFDSKYGSVLRQRATVEITMNDILNPATTLAATDVVGFSKRSHKNFRYFAHF